MTATHCRTVGNPVRSQYVLASIVCTLVSTPLLAGSPVELIGVVRLPGITSDLSGQTTVLENGVPHDRFGGISAIEYSGRDNLYFAVSDRGPDDGATGYLCRFHLIEVNIDEKGDKPVTTQVKGCVMLSDSKDRPFSGMSTEYLPTADCAGRFDPEGCRRGPNGSLFISDEYGPLLVQFSIRGRELRRLPLPDHLLVRHPGPNKKLENAKNDRGRSSNKGMEGLAVSEDGRMLTGVMQAALLQDGRRAGRGKPVGTNCRIVQMDLLNDSVSEFVYQLESAENGLNEILDCGGSQFLVIERDGMAGADARFKKITKINTVGATDVSQYDHLPATTLSSEIEPVAKTEFIDFLDPRFGLTEDELPEKLEGLTWGPALEDGGRTLVVASDNDFEKCNPSLIYVFAIASAPAR